MKILISDNLSEEGVKILEQEEDFEVDLRKKLPAGELLEIIGEYHALIVRSASSVTEEVLEAGTKLQVVGRAGVGVDNIDVTAATRRGIIVMNAPDGNTISAAELTMAHMMSLNRNLNQSINLLKGGTWDRTAFVGRELLGKVLGVLGLGRIGAEVVKRSRAFGMEVLVFDPYASEELADRLEVHLCELDEVFERADLITVHCPLTEDTKHLIDDDAFAKMKEGVRILNCARGGIIDEGALQRALESGKVAGAALDVFEDEPAENHPLLKMENVIATPHLGATTVEAQQGVAVQIARQVVDALRERPVQNALNMPAISADVLELIGPYIDLAERLGQFFVQIAQGPISRVNVTYNGEMNDHDVRPITAALLRGILQPILNRPVNYVSAPMIAQERGINLVESKSTAPADFANLITLESKVGEEEIEIVGTLFGHKEPRIVRINNYHLDAVPDGHMLIVRNSDAPGVIRHISAILADHQINIANMNVGREAPGGEAVTVVNIDTPLDEEGLADMAALPNIHKIRQVVLG